MRAFIVCKALEELLKSIAVATNRAFGHIEKEIMSIDTSTVRETISVGEEISVSKWSLYRSKRP